MWLPDNIKRGMKIKKSHTLLLLVAFVIFGANTKVYAEQLIIPGTGANEVILQELAAAFNSENSEHEVIIPPSVGSGGGISLAGTGKNKLGRVARPFKDDELRYQLDYLPFARDMIIFVVGQRAGVRSLSSQQLAEVFTGKISNWQQVGGNDVRVRLLVREPRDSSLLILRQKLESFKDITFSAKAKMLFHDYEVVNGLNKYTSAIGWLTNSSMKNIQSDVVAIAIDDVSPTQENAYDGKYILTGEYALIYKRNTLDGLVRKFVDFIFSKKGSKILVDRGLVPINQQYY